VQPEEAMYEAVPTASSRIGHHQEELDRTGLDAFCAKYLAASSGVEEDAPQPIIPEPGLDEDQLDRLWNAQPDSERGGL
jgi:hypothetical protein